jgi:hypothetical protein
MKLTWRGEADEVVRQSEGNGACISVSLGKLFIREGKLGEAQLQ